MKNSALHGFLLLAAALGLLVPGRAHATLSCSVSATAMSFGTTVSPLSTTAANSSSSLSISCTAATGDDGGFSNNQTKNASICVSFDNGSGGASGGHRLLKSGSNGASYDLYTTSGLTTIWSDRTGAPGPAAVPPIVVAMTRHGGSVTGSASATAYGSLFGSQTTVPPGSYSSTFSTSDIEAWWADTRTDCNPGGTAPQSTATFGMTVSVTYVSVCQSLTSSTLNFGSGVGFLSANIDAVTSLGVQCTSGTPYKMGLSAGNGSGATTSDRKMTGPSGHTVGYGLYRDSARTQNWGNDTTGGTDTNNGTGSGQSQSYTVYGRVPPQTTPVIGAYSDTIVFTVAY